jgi:hypothetical protein
MFGRSCGQQNFFVNDLVFTAVVVSDSVAFVSDLFPGDVRGFCDTARTAASGNDLNTEMIDSNFSFLLHVLSENVPEHFVR